MSLNDNVETVSQFEVPIQGGIPVKDCSVQPGLAVEIALRAAAQAAQPVEPVVRVSAFPIPN